MNWNTPLRRFAASPLSGAPFGRLEGGRRHWAGKAGPSAPLDGARLSPYLSVPGRAGSAQLVPGAAQLGVGAETGQFGGLGHAVA